jgi:chromosome segregation ATPase
MVERRQSAGELETRVALLEREIVNFSSFFAKLDSTMEKLADVSASIKELLSVHEMRINQHAQQNEHIEDLLEKRKSYFESQKDALNEKLDRTERKLQEDMEKMEHTVIEEMQDLRKELRSYHENTMATSNVVDKLKLMLGAGAAIIMFILYKIGVIPAPF